MPYCARCARSLVSGLQQIVKVISSLGDFMSIKIHACVGGTAVREDVKVS